MNRLKPLSVSKEVLFMFGTMCAILVAIGALLFFSLRSIERGSHSSDMGLLQVSQGAKKASVAIIDD